MLQTRFRCSLQEGCRPTLGWLRRQGTRLRLVATRQPPPQRGLNPKGTAPMPLPSTIKIWRARTRRDAAIVAATALGVFSFGATASTQFAAAATSAQTQDQSALVAPAPDQSSDSSSFDSSSSFESSSESSSFDSSSSDPCTCDSSSDPSSMDSSGDAGSVDPSTDTSSDP